MSKPMAMQLDRALSRIQELEKTNQELAQQVAEFRQRYGFDAYLDCIKTAANSGNSKAAKLCQQFLNENP